MVATRSKTRSSIGGDDQPKIDDVLEDVNAGVKRRASKGGKDGAKNKKAKIDEGNGDGNGEEAKEGKGEEVREDGKGDDAGQDVEASGTSGHANGEEETGEQAREEQGKVDDSSRDVAAEPQAVEKDASPEDTKQAEDTKEAKDAEQPNESEAVTKYQATEEPSAGATDKEQVKEAEKEIVQNDNVTEYGTIHFLYKPKVRSSPSHHNPPPPGMSPIHTDPARDRSKFFTPDQ